MRPSDTDPNGRRRCNVGSRTNRRTIIEAEVASHAETDKVLSLADAAALDTEWLNGLTAADYAESMADFWYALDLAGEAYDRATSNMVVAP